MVRRSLLMSFGCVMVESRCSVLFLGMVVGGCGALRCRQPIGRLFPLRPVQALPVRCWPACVWSAYGQVVAAAAVWSVRGCLHGPMVGLVCVGSVALLPVVASPSVVCVAGTSVLVLVSCILVCPSAV